MRRFFMALTASVALATAASAAGAVDAKTPERGDQVMVLNQDPVTGEFGAFGCSDISWFGTIELAGTTYGMALYSIEGRFTGNGTVLQYEEGWAVWTGQFVLDQELKLVDCEPGEVVLAGVDRGTGSGNDKFRSNGTVDQADDPFSQWLGRRVHQDGVVGPIEYQDLPLFGFRGNLRLN